MNPNKCKVGDEVVFEGKKVLVAEVISPGTNDIW